VLCLKGREKAPSVGLGGVLFLLKTKIADFLLYPNPSTGELWYSLGDVAEPVHIAVYTMDGKLMHQETVANTIKNNKIDYTFAQGLYIVLFRTEG